MKLEFAASLVEGQHGRPGAPTGLLCHVRGAHQQLLLPAIATGHRERRHRAHAGRCDALPRNETLVRVGAGQGVQSGHADVKLGDAEQLHRPFLERLDRAAPITGNALQLKEFAKVA
eukprot:7383043-Prymnesium_polylepis.1